MFWRASVESFEKLMLLFCSCSWWRLTTGPSSSLSSRNVPRRTPRARATLISGPSDGRNSSVSIDVTCSRASPLRSAISSRLRPLASRKVRIFAPTSLLLAVIVCVVSFDFGRKDKGNIGCDQINVRKGTFFLTNVKERGGLGLRGRVYGW